VTLNSETQKRHETITSRSNQWFRRFREAIDRHEGEIVIEGRKQITDATDAGWQPIAAACVDPAEASAGDIVFASALFRALTDTETSQGRLALFVRRELDPQSIIHSAKAPVVALDGVQDPGNVGTIVRLAAAFDASGVILLEGCADAFSQKAIRASVGTVLSVLVARTTRRRLLDIASEEHVALYAARRSGKVATLPHGRSILVLGSEGHGVSREIARDADSVSIPMSDRVESLNVAAAAAILLADEYTRRAGR
jgi:rRNA methylases